MTPTRRPPGVSLDRFLTRLPETPLPERAALVELAQALLGGVYVHLRQKRARYGIDPVQQLRVLRQRLGDLSSRQFHDELHLILAALRDRHTGYLAGPPLAGKAAVLPFLVERFTDPGGTSHYLVTRVADWAPADTGLVVGAELTHLNGIPMQRVVERNAATQRGAHDDARLARGLVALTTRSLQYAPPPEEHWVSVALRADRRAETRVHWRVIETQEPATTAGGSGEREVSALQRGDDPAGQAIQAARRRLYAPSRPRAPWLQTRLPAIFAARPLETRRGTLGYLRIWSFAHADDTAVRDEAQRLVTQLPATGLIVDIRGNPGGSIPTAELLLQVLTVRPVTPAHFSLTNTDQTLAMCRDDPDELGRWTASIVEAVGTGELYAQGLPLTDAERANDLAAGRRYPGPVVLIIDALTYSAADIFAAGFQDNQLGPILGTDRASGAGGANVWTAAQIAQRLTSVPEWPAQPAGGASFTIALRRATRVNARQGNPLEDIGVKPDLVHRLTRNDLLASNQDLLEAAAALVMSPGASAATPEVAP